MKANETPLTTILTIITAAMIEADVPMVIIKKSSYEYGT